MLYDLVTNYKLKGMKHDNVLTILRNPEHVNSISAYYVVITSDIDSVCTKCLDFTFSKDSIIKTFRVNDWKK